MDQKIMSSAQGAASNIQFSYLSNGAWKTFSGQTKNAMDGIKIQTSSNSPYYLQYRTWNQGKTGYYPYVKSNVNDYAGASGRPIQQLQIQAYQNDGTKLTERIVVMYRAYVDGEWLPWVSNADPEWMRSVQNKYDLDGTLDPNASYAGQSGAAISGIEIRVYEEELTGDFSGDEVTASLSYMADSTSNWNDFKRSTVTSHIDGIKIQTGTNKPYYLSYKTWNSGKSSYYPPVKSTVDDYAGSAGKPVQRLNIQAFKNDGTKLTSGVIVMYRAYVNGEWLPWVSNADPKWMRNVRNKYSLGGTLDTRGSFAGVAGENISGVEIRIFEDDSLNAGTDDFSGDELNLSLSYMADSNDNWTGFSEAVTAPHIDGIRIQTDPSLPFYLLYKTLNAGRDTYYPEVLSTGDAYAGSAGSPIQSLSIHAYQTDGTKLTAGVVVMYRAYVDGKWLPWVSNADSEWMRSVQSQYNLGGTLDLSASYAGIFGKDIGGIEIRAFKSDTAVLTPIENLPGEEAAPSLSYMYDSLSNWHSFNGNVTAGHIDGIKIQTSPNKQYYISYQTWNDGKSYYYPEVTSTEDDYAGSPGKPIQRLSIHVYRNDGVKLTTGVVVMYRAYVDGSWLPWVSNADPDWMRSVQSKYNLGGTLDTSGSFAGISGKNIGGIEIRVFEENSTNSTPTTPTGHYKIIQAPFLSQLGKYPTGCESVTAVMALNYAGVDISVDDFIDTYLDMSSIPFDPNQTFGGNPRSTSSYGCYAPVIKKALDRVLSGKNYTANVLSGIPLETLCSEYIDNGIPIILWATMYMKPTHVGATWSFNKKTIQWIAPEHCLLLVGYDDNNYIFNDPMQTQALTYYSKSSVEAAYKGLFSQAVVVVEKEEPTDPPAPPVYQYGAVQNPVTDEIYPIELKKNFVYTIGQNYVEEVNKNESKPTYLGKSTFNVAKFISGLEFDNSLDNPWFDPHMPTLASLAGMFIGGVLAAAKSLEGTYLDIHYYKVAETGEKRAFVNCGDSDYYNFFNNWNYSIPNSLKAEHGPHSGSMIFGWEEDVNNFAKYLYEKFKGVSPNDNYQYDIYNTFDARRKGSRYISQVFFGNDGKMYEYVNFYPTEKFEIVVSDGNNTIERFNFIELLNPVSELPQKIRSLFNIQTY